MHSTPWCSAIGMSWFSYINLVRMLWGMHKYSSSYHSRFLSIVKCRFHVDWSLSLSNSLIVCLKSGSSCRSHRISSMVFSSITIEVIMFVWRSGCLDSTSATTFFFPGMYLISKLSSCNNSNHLACLFDSVSCVCKYWRDTWLVCTVKYYLSKYTHHVLMVCMIANSSFSCMV